MKIFLYGYYGFGNLGDDLLLNSSIEGILNIFPNSTFTIRNYKECNIRNKYREIVKFSNCDQIFENKNKFKISRIAEYIKFIHKNMKGHDILVFGGGTTWHQNPTPLSLLIVLLVMICARLRNIKILALGLGVGPSKGAVGNILLKIMTSMCEKIHVRDEQSFHILRPFSASVTQTADLVYSSSLARRLLERCNYTRQKIIAITLSSHQFGQNPEGIYEALAISLSPLIHEGWRLRILVFQQAGKDGDQALAQRVKDIFPPAQQLKIEISQTISNAESIIASFEGVNIHVGMRFHGAVLASLLAIPFIGISGDHKVHDLAAYYGLPSLYPDQIQEDFNVDLVRDLLNFKYSDQKIEALKNLSEKNFSWFSDMKYSCPPSTYTRLF